MGTSLSRMFWKSTSSSATLFAKIQSSLRPGMGTYFSRIVWKPPSWPTTVNFNLSSPLLTGTVTYFRQIFRNVPSTSVSVFATLLSSLLAGIGTYLSRIPWKLPSIPATVASTSSRAFIAGIGSHVSRIFCMWMSTSTSGTVDACEVSSVDDKEQPTYDGLKTYLLKALECPVCYEVKSGPIFQCMNGHNVCALCRPYINNDKCPVCTADLTSSRNWLAEDLSSKLAGIPCKNVLEGCEEIVFEERMTQHLGTCKFGYSCQVMTSVPVDERYTDCDWVPCGWRGSYRDLMEHVETDHPGHAYHDVAHTTIPDVSLNYLLRVCNHVSLLSALGQLFWCRFALHHETTALGFNPLRPKLKVLAYARLVGSPSRAKVEDADRFTCEFTLRTDSCAALTLSIVCKPRPLGDDLGDENDEGQVLRLCACLLETFISPEKQLSCTIRITREN